MNRNTYNHSTGGWITVDHDRNSLTVTAWTSAGQCLGRHYRTIAGARAAITREHREWRAAADAEHHRCIQAIVANR